MDKLTSRSADSCIISGSDGVYICRCGAESVVADKVPYHRGVGQTDAVQVCCLLAHCREFTLPLLTIYYCCVCPVSFVFLSDLWLASRSQKENLRG